MTDVTLQHDKIHVTLRHSLNDTFHSLLSKTLADLNCKFFSHQFIQNYYQPGHQVSSFYSNANWQHEYWTKYWDIDPLERKFHKVALNNGLVVSLWQVVDPNSEVMEQRTSQCQVWDGFHFALKMDNGDLENFSFGWEKFDTSQLDHSAFLHLSNTVKNFRHFHHQLFYKPTQ